MLPIKHERQLPASAIVKSSENMVITSVPTTTTIIPATIDRFFWNHGANKMIKNPKTPQTLIVNVLTRQQPQNQH